MAMQTLLVIVIGLLILVIILLTILLVRSRSTPMHTSLNRLEEALREEQRQGRHELRQQLDSLSTAQEQRMTNFSRHVTDFGVRTDQRLDALRATFSDDVRKMRLESVQSQQRLTDALSQQIGELNRRNAEEIQQMRSTLELRLKDLQTESAARLEQMRQTVDEKLHATLETRLTESFGNVTEMLAQVHRGLGDMTKLAADVGGLQRALTNVRSRGVFGEMQLAALLEQVFAPDQYAANIATVPGSNERVEFAIRFPGAASEAVWLPIDAKFPREDYERLLDAQERNDSTAARVASDALERRIREEAKRIRSKYVAVPHTTDFALLFLPTESLYAEVLRRPGLFETLQREQRITVTGPTTLLALLTSLQVGFRTLAIEKRSSEVWQILGAVKTEFGKFGLTLDAVKKKLTEASNKIDETGRRSRAIERQLRAVESLPSEKDMPVMDDDRSGSG